MGTPDVGVVLSQWTEGEGETQLGAVEMAEVSRERFIGAVSDLFARLRPPHVASEARAWFVAGGERRTISIREPLIDPYWVARELWIRLVRARERQ